MFKKKPNIKHLAPLRSTDRRKIANQIIKDFNLAVPAPDADGDKGEKGGEVALRDSLLPENCLSAKFTTTTGPDLVTVTGTVYVGAHVGEDGVKGEQRPLWVKTWDEEMFPTVYTLWKNPTILPLLHTHPPVLARLQAGADLMVPGLIGPPFPAATKKGKLVAIASSESPSVPLVVGVCEVDVSGLKRVDGEKGRAVRVVHWVGDEIFNYGGHGGTVPDSIELQVEDDIAAEVAGELGGVALEEKEGGKEKEKEGGEEEVRELSTKEIDEAFRSATLYGIHQYFTTGEFSTMEFPLSSSQFISTLVLPFLPPASHFPPHNLLQTYVHPLLVMKKTSYKNAAKFFKQLEKDRLLKTKTRNGGEVVVMDINWGHQDAKDFTPYKLPEAPKGDKKGPSSGGAAVTGSEGPQKVVELFRPNGKAMNIFSAVGAGTKGFYSALEVRSTLTKYIEKEGLVNPQNKRLVKTDAQISSCLLDDKIPNDADALRTGQIKRDYLGDKLIKSCSPYYVVIKPGESVADAKPKAGVPPRILVLLETRQGKKTVTRVSGVEPFGVDPKAMAEELQKTCAGSASVGQLHGSSPKNPVMEITVQGPQRKVVEAYLEKRGVGERFMNVVDKTGGKKK